MRWRPSWRHPSAPSIAISPRLLAQRVPIRGEAGIGYVLDKGLDMPPLMLTTDEIEAAVLGAQWVINRGDPQLAKAAQDLLAKIEASIPERLRPYIDDPAHRVVPAWDRGGMRLIWGWCGARSITRAR